LLLAIGSKSHDDVEAANWCMVIAGASVVILLIILAFIGFPDHLWRPEGFSKFLSAFLCASLF